jgi:hypothetical protein
VLENALNAALTAAWKFYEKCCYFEKAQRQKVRATG